MNKKGKMFMIMMAVLIQLCLGMMYIFSKAPVSATGCFVIWCICAIMIFKLTEIPETV